MATRKLDEKLTAYIDNKLAKNGSAQLAIQNKDARSLLCFVAESLVGIREVGGNNRGPMVELIQKTAGGSRGDAWCMWFIQTLLGYVEKKLGIKSPIYVSGSCASVWANTAKAQRVKIAPLAGAIAYWRDEKTGLGHTGLFIEKLSASTILTIEGNTEAGIVGGSIERDGGGVYQCHRNAKRNGSKVLVGFLKPF